MSKEKAERKRGKKESEKKSKKKEQGWEALLQELLAPNGIESFVRAGRLPTISGKGRVGDQETHLIQVPPSGISVFIHEEVNWTGDLMYLDDQNKPHIALQCFATPEQVVQLDRRITEEIIKMIEEDILPTRGQTKEEAIAELRANLEERG